MIRRNILAVCSFASVVLLLAFVQMYVSPPMLLAERFWKGAGWIEILAAAMYASIVTHKMKSPLSAPVWRIRIWIGFTIIFFLQLIVGLLGVDKFLMTGRLHLPIPAVILTGSLYRMEVSFMPILLASTILLSGPAWCSQLCYFGAIDAWAAKGRSKPKAIGHKWRYKILGLAAIVGVTMLLRLFAVDVRVAILLAALFALGGMVVIWLISRSRGTMAHCISYCPIGTIVSLAKCASPFRMKINNSCTLCMKCTPSCKYDALSTADIRARKPGLTCTLCGDCIGHCHAGSIEYRFMGLSPAVSRGIYLCTTVSLHAVFMALARI